MIRIFLFHIVIAVLHLASVETTVKMLGVNINAVGIYSNINGLSFNHVFDISKGVTYDSSNNNWHCSGLPLKLSNDKFVESSIGKFKIVENTYRNKFLFFDTGVSPPC